MTISSKERVLLALDHRETDRVPIQLGGIHAPAVVELLEHLGMKNPGEAHAWINRFVDLRSVAPDYVGPKLDRRSHGSHEDIWGVWRSPQSYGDGTYDEICHYPLAEAMDISDLDRHRWPSPEWWDFDGLPDKIKAVNSQREHAIYIRGATIFERSWYMRGFERMFMDLVINPELAQEIMRRVTDYSISFHTRALEAARDQIGIVFTGDDIAGQDGLLMSPHMWEQHLKPHHVRMNKLIKEFGAKVMYHSDGDVMEAVPGLLDMGIDILQALQFSAGRMDPNILKEKYGNTLCFVGGISVQTTLPFGTVEEVRQEVIDRINVLGRNGGYILGPSHGIQAGTPPENVVAMFEAAASFRRS